MSIAYVNGANTGAIIVSPPSPITLTLNLASGDLCIINMRGAGYLAFTGISDTASNFWNWGSSLTFGTSNIQSGWCYNSNSNSSDVITISYSGSPSYVILWADVFSGIATTSAFDVQSTSSGTLSGVTTTNSISPSGSGDLCYAIGSSETTSGAWTPGSGYTTAQAAPGSNGCAAFSMYQVFSGTFSGTVSASQTSGTNSGLLAYTFKAASGPANHNQLMMMGCGT
jgi:hypothetical protein